MSLSYMRHREPCPLGRQQAPNPTGLTMGEFRNPVYPLEAIVFLLQGKHPREGGP